ncbi:MAG TPA: hypothetical protein GX708_15665 [Gallicola sp.]|nr:hypothetical protein [Gallicola sp.]
MKTKHSLTIEEKNYFLSTFLRNTNVNNKTTLKKSAQNVIDFYLGVRKDLSDAHTFKLFMSNYYRNATNYEVAIRSIDEPTFDPETYDNTDFTSYIKYHNLLIAQFIVNVYDKFEEGATGFEKLSDVIFTACGTTDFYDNYYADELTVDTIIQKVTTDSRYFKNIKYAAEVNQKFIDNLIGLLDAWIDAEGGTKCTFTMDMLNVFNNINITDRGLENFDTVDFKSTFNIVLTTDSTEYKNEEPTNRVELKDAIKEIMRGDD